MIELAVQAQHAKARAVVQGCAGNSAADSRARTHVHLDRVAGLVFRKSRSCLGRPLPAGGLAIQIAAGWSAPQQRCRDPLQPNPHAMSTEAVLSADLPDERDHFGREATAAAFQ